MTRLAVTRRVESSKVLGCLLGCFHVTDEATLLGGYTDRLELYRERPTSVLTLLYKQQFHDILLALDHLRGQSGKQKDGAKVQSASCSRHFAESRVRHQ